MYASNSKMFHQFQVNNGSLFCQQTGLFFNDSSMFSISSLVEECKKYFYNWNKASFLKKRIFFMWSEIVTIGMYNEHCLTSKNVHIHPLQ